MVTSLKYLAQIILAADNNWLVVVKNLSWVRTVWRWMLRILNREGAEPRVSGFFLNAMVQAVLLFRSDTWVVTPRMGKSLGGGGVHNQLSRRLTRRLLRRTPNRKWKYTSAAMAWEEAGVLVVEEYIRCHHNTVAQYISTQSLFDLCEGLERALGTQVGMRR